jgi:hypothetical protein
LIEQEESTTKISFVPATGGVAEHNCRHLVHDKHLCWHQDAGEKMAEAGGLLKPSKSTTVMMWCMWFCT